MSIFQYMMLSTKSSRKRNSIPKDEPSKVLLVCIYDTVALDITNDIVYEKFKPFGAIVKLLIFERSEVTKLFIEYAEIQQAENAKSELQGSKLYENICKMNIYFSNFSNVDLKNETSQGADYSESEREHTHFVHRYDQLTKSSPEEDTEVFNDLIMQSFDASPLSRSKTDSPTLLSAIQNRLNRTQIQECSLSEENQIQKSIRSNINSILESNSSSGYYEAVSPTKTTQSSSIKIKEESKSKSTALGFRYDKDIEIRHVYNLFSNFGNISSIVKKKKSCFVRFRSIQFASISYTYLNNYRFMGNALVLQSPTEEEASPKQNEWCQCVFYDSSFDRFTAQKSITINSPSTTLHVSSLKRQICQQSVLLEIFQEFGEVQSVQILKQSSQKNMALVRFYTVEDSFRAIACLHNCVYSGRKMQISFTKPRT